ncbi:hypothetical protein NDU88_004094 [Pleurodeles waltl]|uniref:Uncharacterized protein n=1 Tax=Pleurodeles waltl TaxID=8319 RepID=A0AAV7QDV3_PLEWA|nr:hypothetical protein NDU88_004094 [Pleurodeles waltl]
MDPEGPSMEEALSLPDGAEANCCDPNNGRAHDITKIGLRHWLTIRWEISALRARTSVVIHQSVDKLI